MPSPKTQTPLDTESLSCVITQPAHHAGVMQLRVDVRCNATLLIHDSQASILILRSLKSFVVFFF